MSKNHSTLVHRYPGMDIPEAFIRAVIKARPSAAGYAIQGMEDGKPVLVVDRMDMAAEVEAVQELLSPPEYKDSHALLVFHQFDKFGEDDLQPFGYVVDGDTIDLAYGIEGDIPTMIDGDIHPETKFSKTVITPNINKLRKFTAGELSDFMKELNDPTFKDMVMTRIGTRGYVCFLPPVGEPVWFGKEKFGSSFPWGQVSNTHGYIETPAQQPQPVAEDTRTGWWKIKAGPKLPVAEAKPEVVPVHDKPPLHLPEHKPDTKINTPPADPSAIPGGGKPEGTVEELPGGLKGVWRTLPAMSKKDRKQAIRRVTNCGNNLPIGSEDPNWTYLEVQYPGKANTLPELKEKLEQQQANKPVANAGTKLSTAPTRGSEVVHEANTMILTAEEKSNAEASLLKMMDRQGKEIPPPLKLQQLESKYPTFAGQFGFELGDINNALPEDVKTFAMENGKAFFHLYLETRSALREAEAALAAVGAKHTNAVENHTLAHEELKPEVKKTGTGGWGNWAKK